MNKQEIKDSVEYKKAKGILTNYFLNRKIYFENLDIKDIATKYIKPEKENKPSSD